MSLKSKNKNILSNFNDSHQSQPWCVVSFLSFLNPRQDVADENLLAVKNYTIVNDAISINITTSKSGHMSTAELVLTSGHINYQSALSPGDHVMIWLGDSADDYEIISKAALISDTANGYNSGLKFVGKINSVRTVFSTSSSGEKSVRYSVTCKAFSEFDTQVYFNPLMKPSSSGNSVTDNTAFLARISDQFQNQLFSGGLTYESWNYINILIEMFLGTGPNVAEKNLSLTDSNGKRKEVSKIANNAMLVPTELISMLGFDKTLNGQTYSGIVNRFWGIQQYSNEYEPYANQSVRGSMAPPPDMFGNSNLWSTLQALSNAPINEMYLTLRADNDGDIAPTFVIRQIPFTSDYYKGVEATKFSDLPRWIIDTSRCIQSFNIGTSDALRFNFIQVYGQFFGYHGKTGHEAQQAQIIDGNYVAFNSDISRHGPRTLLQNTICDMDKKGVEGNTGLSVSSYVSLIGDWYKNGHLKLTGSITTSGIKQPICVGDNLQVENQLFHIESVSHQYSCSDSGIKSFTTNMALSHGITLGQGLSNDITKSRADMSTDFAPGYTDEEDYVNHQKISSGIENSVETPDIKFQKIIEKKTK